ncbi:MAG TPA: DinB family protein [Thermoanaerobaculia bacterium]|jgi:uncharacterized damage-inducible protein DinB|nr:DinB family protein [Thermoanaerobaculia bacterium]
MLDELSDLFDHQQWADSVHWRTLAAHAGALEDDAVRKRLHHIHAVQRSFLDVWNGTPRRPPTLPELGSTDALRRFARDYYRELSEFLAAVPRTRLDETLGVPWFPDPKRPIRMAETMQQVVMHSEHHRAQNAVRLRELGGVMPPTDYIYWIVEGRSAPVWGESDPPGSSTATKR